MISDPLIGTPGPFEVRCEHLDGQSSSSQPELPAATADVPRRRYDCACYETCLGLAASLNWESFTCRGCSGQLNENLLWRARVTARKDTVAARLLNAPQIAPINSPHTPLPTEQETSSGS